jgi:hypothetical protein
MAPNFDFIFPDVAADTSIAEEENLKASRIETAVTVVVAVITVLIVATISVLMAMA